MVKNIRFLQLLIILNIAAYTIMSLAVNQINMMDKLPMNYPMEKTWSNRQGLALTPITTGVWAAERPFIWNKIDVGGRMVVCRVSDGCLLVNSPICHTKELSDCLEALGGGVGHIVSPNYEHLKYAKQWSDIYPNAKMHACPGLPLRMKNILWADELGINQNIPSELGESMDVIFFDCEINPFTKKPFFNEIVLFHKPSKSLIMTDTFWNYPSTPLPNYYGLENTGMIHECTKISSDKNSDLSIAVPSGTKKWKFGMDKVFLPFYKNLMVGKGVFCDRRRKYEIAVKKVLALEALIIIPCHGDVIRGKELCRNVLQKHFSS